MKLFMGIEGIALRRSVSVLSDATGKILAAARLPFSLSLQVTRRDELRPRLLSLVRTCADRAGCTLADMQEACICIGISGITCTFDKKVDLVEQLRWLKPEARGLTCATDARIVLVSHLQRLAGSAIVCHQGSLAYVSTTSETAPPARQRVFGGWGPLLLEPASGFELGRAAMRTVMEGYDRDPYAEPSSLRRHIMKWLEKPDDDILELRETAIRWRRMLRQFAAAGLDPRDRVSLLSSFCHFVARSGGMSYWRKFAASMVVPLMQAAFDADDPDPEAKEIVRKAADALAAKHAFACKQAKVLPCFAPIVLFGGVLTHNIDFMNLVIDAIREHHPENADALRFVTPRDPNTLRPACGALLLALGGSHTERHELPPPEVLDRVRETAFATTVERDLRND